MVECETAESYLLLCYISELLSSVEFIYIADMLFVCNHDRSRVQRSLLMVRKELANPRGFKLLGANFFPFHGVSFLFSRNNDIIYYRLDNEGAESSIVWYLDSIRSVSNPASTYDLSHILTSNHHADWISGQVASNRWRG